MKTTKSCFAALAAVLSLAVSACGGSVDGDSGTGGAAGSSGSGGTSGAGGGGSGGFSGTGGATTFCVFEGSNYYPGAVWTTADGCNSCHCSETGGTVSCTKLACANTCEYGGQTYKEGESFSANDGCNTCTCGPGGKVMCTQADCMPTCTYAGKEYKMGDSFPAIDGCNKCSCTASGVSCTEIACACDPTKEWWRSYIGKSPQECMTIKYACPSNTTAFSNACGCGCEQDASCPQTIDCMPPAPNCDAMQKKCPYSGVAY